MKNESNQSDQRVFRDRGREGLFFRAFGKRNIQKEISVEDIQKIVNANEKFVKELKLCGDTTEASQK